MSVNELASERIKFKLAVIVYRALHGTAPQYLSDQLQYVADLPTRHRGRLCSSTSSLREVRPSRCVTVGDRSFAIKRIGTLLNLYALYKKLLCMYVCM